MAEGEDVQSPQSINAEESRDYTTVTVKMVIPNLEKKKFLQKIFGSKPKPGDPEVDVKFDTQSFEMNAAVTHKGRVTKYYYKCNQLPGEIAPDKCKFELQKEMIVLTLVKTDTTTWAVKLSSNGLDQAPSD